MSRDEAQQKPKHGLMRGPQHGHRSRAADNLSSACSERSSSGMAFSRSPSFSWHLGDAHEDLGPVIGLPWSSFCIMSARRTSCAFL